MLLQATKVNKRLGRNQILRDVSFAVGENEILGLIGPNGAGKSTLFECLAGMMPMDSGSVACSAEMFYVPDGIRPWASRRVSAMLEFFTGLWRRQPDATLLQKLALKPLLDARISSLSKGELRRLLLAFGLMTPHRLLLLDEPFDGLDFRQTREVMALLRTYPAQGRTLFLSIHQLTDAARVCDRFILLSRGHIAGVGTLEQLRDQAGIPTAESRESALEAAFLALT